ncbi:hypothetical protein BGM26_05480 [Bacillus sp. FJAT-29790]|nr:hypothetical protein [Bacillus sp. FJAT-29790]MBU8878440.1 hypothetical protein [Bacillus sp. FJAT-29790]
MNAEQIWVDKLTFIGRLFTVGSSIFFFIGAIIAAIVAFPAFKRAVCLE